MSDYAIKIENLGKKYIISHQNQAGYKTFRDVLVEKAKNAANLIMHPLSGGGAALSAADYEEFWALRDVSLEIKAGERVGIIGRNGAGKSTLLKILSRITDPSAGDVWINGRVASLLEVGTGFHPELTGRENIYLNGAILGMGREEIKRKFDEIVAFSEVEKFLDTPVKRYSSGMYVRLAFSVAAHLEPEILVVDEVLAVGDAAFQKKCLGKMEDVGKEGRTILFVSHNMGVISGLCERGIYLKNGEVSCFDSAEKAISCYLNQTPNELPGMNSLVGHPNREKGLKPYLSGFEMVGNSKILEKGKPFSVKISYNFDRKIVSPFFYIIFTNALGAKAFTLDSVNQNNNIPPVLEGEGEIICNVESMPLLPGNYYISLKLWIQGQKLDDVENVFSFDVELPSENNDKSYKWNSSTGMVYVDANWILSGGEV